jgi:hypothetical protein
MILDVEGEGRFGLCMLLRVNGGNSSLKCTHDAKGGTIVRAPAIFVDRGMTSAGTPTGV